MQTLTICIPTFNNPEGIRKTLQHIFQEVRHLSRTAVVIEVCIRDNSEDTRTEVVVRDASYPFTINYERNEQNVGYDRNVDRVLKMAHGDFCWLLSDNEPLREGAVHGVFEALKNAEGVGHIVIAPDSIPKENLRKYKNLEEAIVQNGYWIPGGLVSRNIFARHLIPSERSAYFGNDWMHLSLAVEIGKNNPVLFIPEQFKEEDAFCGWAKNGATFRTYTNLYSIMTNLPPPYTPALTQTLGARMRRRLPREILSSKIYGLKNTPEVRTRLREVLRGNPVLLALSLIALMIPTSLLRYAQRIKHSTYR